MCRSCDCPIPCWNGMCTMCAFLFHPLLVWDTYTRYVSQFHSSVEWIVAEACPVPYCGRMKHRQGLCPCSIPQWNEIQTIQMSLLHILFKWNTYKRHIHTPCHVSMQGVMYPYSIPCLNGAHTYTMCGVSLFHTMFEWCTYVHNVWCIPIPYHV